MSMSRLLRPVLQWSRTRFVYTPRIANSLRHNKFRFSYLVGSGFATSVFVRRVRCEATQSVDDPWLLVAQVRDGESRTLTKSLILLPYLIFVETWKVLRKALRCLSLFIRFVPVLSVYPLTSQLEALDNLWWKIFLFILQKSGPTFVKLGQWASTRRDIFSKRFCDKLCILHTKTKNQRYFRDKVKVFDEVFGRGFFKRHGDDVFVSIEPYSIGSGCIAQVYKARVNVAALEAAVGRSFPKLAGNAEKDIAIKVADADVESKIELDLSIMKCTATVLQTLMPSLAYVDPIGAVEQFEMVLRRQVDLGNEGRALMRFAENFDPAKTGVRFPVVLGFSKNILVETFENGIYINRLVAEAKDPELSSRQAPAVRRRIALLGARALLKMIFVDNFVHGDLHPGNILIQFNEAVDILPGVHMAPQSASLLARTIDSVRSVLGWRGRPSVRFTDSPFTEDEPTIVLLDTGIAIAETPENLYNLKSLFRAIVERKGYEAGRMLLTRSKKQECKDADKFCSQVDELVNRAMAAKSLRKLNISGLLSELFSIVAEHKVLLDSSFTTVILSVMVLEGFGRSLDPDLDLFNCARPYLLNVMF